jgi:uncharacterized membrane protein YiaA
MSFAIYAIGYLIFIVGLSIAAHLLHVAPRWIAVMDLVLAGLGIMSAVRSTRQRDPS